MPDDSFRDTPDSTPRKMRLPAVCLALLALFTTSLAFAQAAPVPTVFPQPAHIAAQAGTFRIDAGTPLVVPGDDDDARRAAEQLQALILKSRGLTLGIRRGKARNGAINFVRDAAAAPDGGSTTRDEAYRLSVDGKRVTITASGHAGFVYGAGSLWQLLPEGKAMPMQVPGVAIDDQPRFAWRGLMLDSARHYQSPEFIKRYIDVMSLHKLNTLHWHLTDDQAWRLEIKKYPKLTGIASQRIPAGAAALSDIDYATKKPREYGGFYTREQVRDLVAYAAERAVTIVPEIEMPGHATATLVAYPQFAASATPPTAVPSDWGIYPNVYAPSEETFTFLTDVLTEVMALFPGQYIHVGGDEVEKTQWLESPAARARMKELGSTDPAVIPAYFTRRIGTFLEAHGRRMVGWDEILHPDMAKGAVVMSWQGTKGALEATKIGHDSVLSAWPTLYLDNRQGEGDGLPGRVRQVTLKDIYDYSPVPEGMTADQEKHLLGIQANLWTEHIRTEQRAGVMSFPRAAAIADLGWTAKEQHDWPRFVRDLPAVFRTYQAFGMPFSDAAFAPAFDSHVDAGDDKALVSIRNQVEHGDIRYTTDGSTPRATSPRYATALDLPLPVVLTAATFVGDQAVSDVRSLDLDPKANLRRTSEQLTLCTDGISLLLEDDAPVRDDPRAVFKIDIQNPCWILPKARLDGVRALRVDVGNLPFNFQIGAAKNKITFVEAKSIAGDLVVTLDGCAGPEIARLPLLRAIGANALTTLEANLPPRTGEHDLCLRFGQPTLDPLWAIDSLELLRQPVDGTEAR